MAEVAQKSGGGRTVRDALKIRADGLRGKGKYRADYDAKGNLDIRDKEGKFVDHIAMPNYRPITEDELAEMFEARAAAVHEAEETVEKLMPELREIITKYKATASGEETLDEPILLSDILLLNQRLKDSYAQYTLALGPEREVVDIGKRPYSSLGFKGDSLFEEGCLESKPTYTIKRLYTRRLPMELSIMRSAPAPPEEEPSEAAAAEAAMQVPGERYTMFRNADDANGFLSPDAPVDFIWKGTSYMSVRQAIEAEKARAAGNAGLVQTILRAKTSLRAKQLGTAAATKATGEMKISQDVLTDIVRASFAGNEERAKLLKQTGGTTLVFADQGEKMLGVGRDPQQAQRAQWQGENLYGKALSAVRQTLTTAATNPFNDDEEAAGGSSSAAATAEQQKTVGGIIARRRMPPTFVKKA